MERNKDEQGILQVHLCGFGRSLQSIEDKSKRLF